MDAKTLRPSFVTVSHGSRTSIVGNVEANMWRKHCRVSRPRVSRYYAHHPLQQRAPMIPNARRTLSTIAVLMTATIVSLHAQNVTTKDLTDGLANPSRWLTHSGDYTGARFSPLTQI